MNADRPERRPPRCFASQALVVTICPDPNCNEGIAGPDDQRCARCDGEGFVRASDGAQDECEDCYETRRRMTAPFVDHARTAIDASAATLAADVAERYDLDANQQSDLTADLVAFVEDHVYNLLPSDPEADAGQETPQMFNGMVVGP